MRTFVIGDIHGEINQLTDCLITVGFDDEKDRLISLGDVVDRGLHSYEVIERLLQIKNLIAVRGNHDDCFINAVLNKQHNPLYWQGGRETEKSYLRRRQDDSPFSHDDVPNTHIEFFNKQVPYHVESNICFVHGGFDRYEPIDNQIPADLYWNRQLVEAAMSCSSGQKLKTVDNFDAVFVGHTPTQYFNSHEPISKGGVINLDTGCGKFGHLTIWNLETSDYYQSKWTIQK